MPSAARTCVSFANFSYIGKMRLETAPRLHAAQVPVVTIGTNHVLPFAERLVGDHLDCGVNRADRATVRSEDVPNLCVLGQPEVLAERREELHLVQAVVAAHERGHDAAVD